MDNLTTYTKILQNYFNGWERPAQTLLEVKGLALPGMMVEVEAIAVL